MQVEEVSVYVLQVVICDGRLNYQQNAGDFSMTLTLPDDLADKLEALAKHQIARVGAT